jgi:hypothetical protein
MNPLPIYRRGVREDAFIREVEGTIPTDGIPWSAATHQLWSSRLLTIDDPRASNPSEFKGELFTPQKTLLAAMLALEQNPFISIEDSRCPEEWVTTIQTRMGRISEKFSFGKTVLALALVCSRKNPILLPDQQPIISYPHNSSHYGNRANVVVTKTGGSYDPIGAGFLPEITVNYSKFLPITIVSAAANVISQWESETKRFTRLRYFIIENVHSLREFEKMYRNGSISAIDIVFVKAGRVTTNFTVSGENTNFGKAKNRSLFETLIRILEGVPVARLIIDDYDTLKLSNDDCFIPALFTWLISATRRQTSARAILRTGQATIQDFFRANLMTSFPILGGALDDVLNRVFSLHCAPEYVDEHINSTKMIFRRIYVRGGHATAILRDLEVPEEIIEMVNADAIETAAQTLGIAAKSIGEVINRIVGIHLGKLQQANKVLERIKKVHQCHEDVKALKNIIKDGSDEEFDAYNSPVSKNINIEITSCIKSLEEWAKEQLDKYGKTLNRMRDNIREGHCQCCMVPFEKEPAYVLSGCCQIIVCEPCITKINATTHKKSFIQRCPNCAQDVKIKTGLIRIGVELDIESALYYNIEPLNVDLVLPSVEPDLLDFNNPKLKALIQLLQGTQIDSIHDIFTAPYVEGLLDGKLDTPWPKDKPNKFLIFTMHTESTRLIANTLESLEIPFCILRGSRSQKDEAVRTIKDSNVNIMLVTAAKDCGGLNLPFISHIVFYHRIIDRNVEAQMAARGQRLGREANLEIVTFINEFEAEGLPPYG